MKSLTNVFRFKSMFKNLLITWLISVERSICFTKKKLPFCLNEVASNLAQYQWKITAKMRIFRNGPRSFFEIERRKFDTSFDVSVHFYLLLLCYRESISPMLVILAYSNQLMFSTRYLGNKFYCFWRQTTLCISANGFLKYLLQPTRAINLFVFVSFSFMMTGFSETIKSCHCTPG